MMSKSNLNAVSKTFVTTHKVYLSNAESKAIQFSRKCQLIRLFPMGKYDPDAISRKFGRPGDVLEAYEAATYQRWGGLWCGSDTENAEVEITYDADKSREWRMLCHDDVVNFKPGYRQAVHMPYWGVRLQLYVKSMLVKTIQDLSYDEIKREGYHPGDDGFWSARDWYRDSITERYGNKPWLQNHPVICIKFSRL
jgi:hypothetical protein